MREVSIITSPMNKQTLLEKPHRLPSDHRKNPSTSCSQLVALTVEVFLVTAPLFPTAKTGENVPSQNTPYLGALS